MTGKLTIKAGVFLLVLLVVASVGIDILRADDTVTFQQGVNGYSGCVDTAIYEGSSANSGGATALILTADYDG